MIRKLIKYGFLTGILLFVSYFIIRIVNSDLDDTVNE